MFKKKEKPMKEYSFEEIISKTIYTKEYAYLPTKVSYYENRLELCVDRCEPESAEPVSFTVSVPRTEERLLRFDLDGAPFYWDTRDEAFRVKPLPEGEPTPLIPPVLFYPNEVMTLERGFAEEHLSPLALSYATLRDDRYAWYYPDGSASPAVFETPRLFALFNGDRHPLNADYMAVINNLLTFTPSYLEETGLNPDDLLRQYKENFKKGASA